MATATGDSFQAAWSDVFYLAFLYLDVDGDGQLSADDLSVHLPGGVAVALSRSPMVELVAVQHWDQPADARSSCYMTLIPINHY